MRPMADPPEPSDEELMLAYARGRSEAFERLFERHRRRLFTHLVHLIGDRARAEDVFQEVFLRVIRKRAAYAHSGNFRAWLYTIAHNASTDERRRSAVRDTRAIPMDEHVPDTIPDPAEATHRGEIRERIEAALLRLPAVQREVFLLRERAGLDFASIARATGCGLATAKSRMRYALENLRRQLETGELAATTETGHE